MIKRFSGKYEFLSNFHYAPVEYEGTTYESVEVAFVAAKTLSLPKRQAISLLNAREAKRMSRTIELRPNWDIIKVPIMYNLLRQKFSKDPLKNLLKITSDAPIVEGNYWHDNFWGSCTCSKCNNSGRNVLGILLMKIRKL